MLKKHFLLLSILKTGLLIFLCVLLLVKHLRDVLTNNMPPGPFPLPLIGNVLNIGFTDPLGSFQRVIHILYGDVSTLYLGNNPCILLTGYESFKEAFVEQADIFTDRPYFPIIDKLSKGKGLIFSSGHMWHQQRRFALAALKYFGVGKKTLENSILQECRFLCDSIQAERGLPFNPQHLVTDAVANIICGLVFGHRFEYDDHKFHLIQEYLDDVFQLPISNWGRLYNQFPTLMSMLPGKHQTAFASMSKLKPFLQEEIIKHKEERDPSNPRDYIDFNQTCDFCWLSSQTTISMLFVGYFLSEKVQSEIDQVIGQTRQPLMDDRTNLPYTYAVLHEIHDTTVGGRLISKGVMVLPLLKSILQDKNENSTPYEFNPAHFLDENGKFLKKDSFIPFSIGKRLYPGEQLARMELFLFFTSLMQCFTFLPLEGRTLSLKGTIGVSSGPEPFQIRAVPQ
uniref:Cytochrome P450, family 2, subfamily AE, polypeptide 1 n=1 Tax=Sinocyclocheilus rhinocerous TaxID=307959 RepID=A0A673GJN1_9TELE